MSENKKSVLVFGGTGAMGKALVRKLAEQGYAVVVTSRSHHESEADEIRYVQGDAKNPEFLKGILSGCIRQIPVNSRNHQQLGLLSNSLCDGKWDAIVDFMSYSTEEFRERVNLLLESTEQYIFLSSARVYAESAGKLTEDSPRLLDVCGDKEYLSTDEYALAKARQENILVESRRNNYTIVRPSLTYSDNRLQFAISEKEEWLYRAVNGRSIIFPQNMQDIKTSMAWGEDVSSAIARLVSNDKAQGEIVQIASETALTWGDVLDVYQNVLDRKIGNRAKVFYTPDALKIGQDLNRYYQIKYARAISRQFDCSKLRAIAGDIEFIGPEEGLSQCLDSFLKAGRFGQINVNTQAYFDRLSKEHTPLHVFHGKDRLRYIKHRYI